MDFSFAAVEIFLFVAAVAVVGADLFLPVNRRWLHWATIIVLLLAALASLPGDELEKTVALNGFFAASPFTAILKTAILLSVAGGLAFSRHYLRDAKMLCGELHGLMLLATLGMLVMVSAGHFLSLYLGLELMSLCLYALIAYRRDDDAASESALKYFVLGALASGLFLYGVSIIYGATGELGIFAVAEAIFIGDESRQPALVLGLVFVLAGMAFKLGAAPFHMWLPDVYQGAPTPITLFIAAGPKVATLAMVLRVLVEALGGMAGDWQGMLMVLAVASLAIGNITAIAQSDLKRMLAYSSIAHSGFMLLAVLAGGVDGAAAAVFYVIIYALMTVGGFGALTVLAANDDTRIDAMRGLASRNIIAATALMVLMFSMAGIPPFVGFMAKLTVLEAVARAGHIWLVVVAVLFSVVGAFYYLRVVRLMFFEKTEEKEIALPLPASLLLVLVSILILYLGIFPGDLLSATELAVGVSI